MGSTRCGYKRRAVTRGPVSQLTRVSQETTLAPNRRVSDILRCIFKSRKEDTFVTGRVSYPAARPGTI